MQDQICKSCSACPRLAAKGKGTKKSQRSLCLSFYAAKALSYFFHSTGKNVPAFSASSLTPSRAAARASTGLRRAVRSAPIGNTIASGMTPTFSRLLPSGVITSALVTLTPYGMIASTPSWWSIYLICTLTVFAGLPSTVRAMPTSPRPARLRGTARLI